MEKTDLETRIQRYLATSRLYIFDQGERPKDRDGNLPSRPEAAGLPATIPPGQANIRTGGMVERLVP